MNDCFDTADTNSHNFGEFTHRDAKVVPNKTVSLLTIRLILGRLACGMFSIFVRPSINDLLQSYKQVIDVVSSPNCALSIDRIIAGFTCSLVRNLTTMSCVLAEGSICLLIRWHQRFGPLKCVNWNLGASHLPEVCWKGRTGRVGKEASIVSFPLPSFIQWSACWTMPQRYVLTVTGSVIFLLKRFQNA
jgi:hypothetical protein